jgi:hypothetical protein
MLIISGLVGPKARLKSVVDGQQVNIPVLLFVRPKFCEFRSGRVTLTKVGVDVRLRVCII